MAKELPIARLTLIPMCGHHPANECPYDFARRRYMEVETLSDYERLAELIVSEGQLHGTIDGLGRIQQIRVHFQGLPDAVLQAHLSCPDRTGNQGQ